MPTYSYNAVTRTGQRVSSTKDAKDSSDLARLLREEGLILTSAKEADAKNKKRLTLAKLELLFGVPLMEKIIFTQHLAVMIGAGLSLTRALEALGQQTPNKRFAAIVKSVTEEIRKGVSFADALAKYPKVFSELFINMIRVGETSGNLEEVLRVLADQMKKDHDLRSRVKGAMIYPAVILLVMLGIGALMMIVVIPKLTVIFKEVGMELPATTRFIIWLSDNLNAYWPFLLVALAALIVSFRYWTKTISGKKIFDRFLLKAPIFGNIIKKVNSARFARTLSALIKSGLPIAQSLQIVSGTLGNVMFRDSLVFSAAQIQKGQPLSASLKNFSEIYPPMVSQMTEVGEETGTLDVILEKLAEFYEEEVSNITKNLSSIIEPVLMVIIGAAVGFFAISMLQPMYSMMEGIK